MNRSIILVVLTILTCFVQGVFGGTLSFQGEAARVTKALSCPEPKITPSIIGSYALYFCVVGTGETVKFFINEAEGTSQVRDVKLMWNDWFVDTGDGIHADKREAEAFVKAFAKLYAPNMEKKLMSIFFSNSNTTVEVGDYQIAYTYTRGFTLDERLFVLTPKEAVLEIRKSNKQIRKSEANNFNACKAAVVKAVGYTESLLSGDGVPIQQTGSKSFFLRGRQGDLFFCEVHPGARYKVKAALNGTYPYKYIAEGKF